jgi:acyl transferase domain-containing protein
MEIDKAPDKDRKVLLQNALEALDRMQAKMDRLESGRREPVAIIGMACRYPGHVKDPESFWRLLQQGVDAIEEVPASRWDREAYFAPDEESPGKICTRFGGFVDEPDCFDPQFFGISPREALSMDPQHRLALEVAWEALESAAQAPAALAEKRVGVFLGITTRDYAGRLTHEGFEDLDAYALTGNLSAFAAGRISYVLGLQGVATAVDTACSSSLVAIHLACQSLRCGESSMALAGGVNMLLWPEISVTETKAHMLAPDGRCKTFDSRADGFVRSEGCGVLVMKRLSDAVACGDNILALIQGSYCNQDGASSGLTVPNPRAQKAVIEGALECAGIAPEDIGYVETHGTGTALGDPIELGSLAAVFGSIHSKANPLLLGSVKSNIGHLESAAGVASVMKVILALLHEEIPPNLHFREPNPHVQWEQLPFAIPTSPTPWKRTEKPRVAGVSSFGASGTNAHLVVEEAPSRPKESSEARGLPVRPLHVLTISARSATALSAVASRYADFFDKNPHLDLADAAFTANVGRNHFAYRRGFVGENLGEVSAQLRAFSEGNGSGIGAEEPVRSATRMKIAFLFTGQGSQKPGMGALLYRTLPVFKEAMNRCDQIVSRCLGCSLLSVVFPEDGDGSRINQTMYTQPALFAFEYSLSEVWRSWGVIPDAVIGHSIGEYVAACVAGVFSLEDGLSLVCERSRLMQGLPNGGAMAVAFSSEDLVRAAIKDVCPEVAIAALNGPQNITLSGPSEQLQAAVRRLLEKGVESRLLEVSHAFHSGLIEPALGPFESFARRLTYRAAKIPLVSNLTGDFFPPEDKPDATYWTRHARGTVRFADGLHALHERKIRLFLELGPDGVLTGIARSCFPGNGVTPLTSLRRNRNDLLQMLECVGALHASGVLIDWKAFDEGYGRRFVILPSYPFEKKSYWVAPPKPGHQTGQSKGDAPFDRVEHPLLQARFRSPLVSERVYESRLGVAAHSFLRDLKIHGTSVLSFAAVVEIAQAAARDLFGEGTHTVSGLILQNALSVRENESPRVQCIVNPDGENAADLRIISLGETTSGPPECLSWIDHATCRISKGSHTPSDLPPSLADIQSKCSVEAKVDDHYEALRAQGFHYGDSLRGIERLFRGNASALGLIQATTQVGQEREGYILHPGLLDACLQVFPAAWQDIDPNGSYLPMGVEEAVYFSPPEGKLWSCAAIRRISGKILAGDIWILGESGKTVARLKAVTFTSISEEALRKSVENRAYAAPVDSSKKTQRSSDIKGRLSQTPVAERHALLTEWLQSEVAHVLRITPPESVDRKLPLTNLGLDSLMAMELRSSTNAALTVDTQLGDLLAGPTVEEWARQLMDRIPFTGVQAEESTGQSPPNAAASLVAMGVADSTQAQALLQHLDQLSEEDVEKVLESLSAGGK